MRSIGWDHHERNADFFFAFNVVAKCLQGMDHGRAVIREVLLVDSIEAVPQGVGNASMNDSGFLRHVATVNKFYIRAILGLRIKVAKVNQVAHSLTPHDRIRL